MRYPFSSTSNNSNHKYIRSLWTKTWRETGKVAKANPSPHFRFRLRFISNLDHPAWNAERERQNKVAAELQKLGVDGSQLEWEAS